MDSFWKVMQEQEPGNRARFLAHVYEQDKRAFEKITPDQILIDEFGAGEYVQLANQKIVPIAAVPAGIVLAI